MADINNELMAIAQAEYGEEVRGSIISAISSINDESTSAKEFAEGETNSAKAYAESAKGFSEDAESAASRSETTAENMDTNISEAKTEINQKVEQTTKHVENAQDILSQIITIRDQLLGEIFIEEDVLDSEGNNVLDSNGNPIKVLKSKTSTDPPEKEDPVESFNLDKVYPVGAIYMSVNSTDPGELFGGVWETFSRGRVPVGVDLEDADYNEAEKIGGSKHHYINTSQLPHQQFSFSGSTSIDLTHSHYLSLTSGTDSVGHYHNFNTSTDSGHHHNYYAVRDGYGTKGTRERVGTLTNNDVNHNTSTNGSHAHTGSTNAASSGHTHTTSGNTNNALSSKTITISGTTTAQTHTQRILDMRQPYITCYMWKRIE